eukprot:1182964-Prorocentrum_minimum.AAC.2
MSGNLQRAEFAGQLPHLLHRCTRGSPLVYYTASTVITNQSLVQDDALSVVCSFARSVWILASFNRISCSSLRTFNSRISLVSRSSNIVASLSARTVASESWIEDEKSGLRYTAAAAAVPAHTVVGIGPEAQQRLFFRLQFPSHRHELRLVIYRIRQMSTAHATSIAVIRRIKLKNRRSIFITTHIADK